MLRMQQDIGSVNGARNFRQKLSFQAGARPGFACSTCEAVEARTLFHANLLPDIAAPEDGRTPPYVNPPYPTPREVCEEWLAA
jgi:hypothetical protein